MDETRIEASAGGDQHVPLYLSNCDPGDETDAELRAELESEPVLADAA